MIVKVVFYLLSFHKKHLLVSACIALVSCTSTLTVSRKYDGKDIGPDSVSHIYIGAASALKYGTMQAVYQIKKIEGNDANIENMSGVISVLPGRYQLFVKWSRILSGDTTVMVMPDGGAIPLPGTGNAKVFQPKKLYIIEIDAKPGMTYVVELGSTVPYKTTRPPQLCVTEETHSAKGHWTPMIGHLSRVPSKNAKIIACSKE